MDTASPKVSVIVPIYNVEEYLEECLDSILAQTFADIEVICVNDGSTDGSLEIIRRYEARDGRIKVIDKPNGGYGHSVNRGLEMARGEWISIIEPDDKVDPRMYADLLALGEAGDGAPADIVKGSYWLYFHFEGKNPYVKRPHLMNCMPQGVCELDMWTNPEVLKHHPSIWAAIYRKSFIDGCGIRMIEPKGAGWADNPWFYETMLQAKRIIWTPTPYYYYRQTNPEASSVLKDYHMPFDRLRDIRAVYERLGIDDKKLLQVLYGRSFNYICSSILEEFEFPENDPELQDLILEVFETFDKKILMEKENGIPQKRKVYYRNFMGEYLKSVKPKDRCENPRFSFVVAMRADRRGLWETISGFLKQRYANFEVICVDCDSPDRSLKIASDVARIDHRFSVLEGAGSVSAGFQKGLESARGDYVMFLRPGEAFADRDVLMTIRKGIDALGVVPDIVLFQRRFTASRLLPDSKKFKSVWMLTEGIESDVAIAAFPNSSNRLYRRAFLEEEGLAFTDERDDGGWEMCVKASARARTAAYVEAYDMVGDTRYKIVRDAWHDEPGMISYMKLKYDTMIGAAEALGDETAYRIARSCIVRHMAVDVARIGWHRSGRTYFEAIRDMFESDDYGLHEFPVSEYANYLDFGVLEEAFSLDYIDYASDLLARQQKIITNMALHRDKLVRKLREVKRSGSYKLARKMSKKAKKAVPSDVRRAAREIVVGN